MKTFADARDPKSSITIPMFGMKTEMARLEKNQTVVMTILLLNSPSMNWLAESFINSAYKPSSAPLVILNKCEDQTSYTDRSQDSPATNYHGWICGDHFDD